MPAVLLPAIEPDAAAGQRLPEHIRRALAFHLPVSRPVRLVAANDAGVSGKLSRNIP
jgi:hypothetical protein